MLRWFKRSSTATESPPGAELEAIRQYRVTRKLGEGGMGVVYEARDGILHRAEEKSREAAAAFRDAGGERLLGIAG